MDRRLFDTSAIIDQRRAPKWPRAEWAQTTLRHLALYRAHQPFPTISGLTVFELLDGYYREERPNTAQAFRAQLRSDFDVIYPDEAIILLAAEINAALAKGQTIGVADTLIAATAITQNITLVTSNDDHFARVLAAGFPLSVENWREP